jgi:Holliday junction resolvase RusA-like endonuclease
VVQEEAAAALIGNVLPGSRPDLSNILKLCEDAMTSVVFTDDALVCVQYTQKAYGTSPRIVVTVKTLAAGNSQ